jgi:small ligand-binding sensory domain FIST
MFASSGVGEHASIHVAVRNAFQNASDHLREKLSCIFLFVSGDELSEQKDAIQNALQQLAPQIPVFGCSAESIVGTGREIEGQSAASILLVGGLSSPPTLFSMECIKTPDGPTVLGFNDDLIAQAHVCNGMLVVGCPRTFSIDMLNESLEPERGQPVVPILGGYCSSQNWDQENLLFCGDRILNRGAVGLVLPPELEWHTIVSQGCRPIGDPMLITALDGNTILGLGGRPALPKLREMFQKLPNHERAMAIDALLIGRAITEYSDTFSHGDFLIRNVQGIDADVDGVVVTDRFQVGQTIRFHVRDAEGADADFTTLLERLSINRNDSLAAMLFSCNGRGHRMFTQPNHDALAIDRFFPGLPLAGFFAAGEFAPIGNRNLSHGFTAVAAFLGPTQSNID